MMIKTYSALTKLTTFKERFLYLKVPGSVGAETFGHDRYLNQIFYNTIEWRKLRDEIIFRDNGCDLGVEGYEIYGKIFLHHIEPIDRNDVLYRTDKLLNPDNLICVSFRTHQAIHYGDESILVDLPPERLANDTCPWRK